MKASNSVLPQKAFIHRQRDKCSIYNFFFSHIQHITIELTHDVQFIITDSDSTSSCFCVASRWQWLHAWQSEINQWHSMRCGSVAVHRSSSH
jgi:hypothetical protein